MQNHWRSKNSSSAVSWTNYRTLWLSTSSTRNRYYHFPNRITWQDSWIHSFTLQVYSYAGVFVQAWRPISACVHITGDYLASPPVPSNFCRLSKFSCLLDPLNSIQQIRHKALRILRGWKVSQSLHALEVRTIDLLRSCL